MAATIIFIDVGRVGSSKVVSRHSQRGWGTLPWLSWVCLGDLAAFSVPLPLEAR
jgi:hypothetical protein